MVLFFGVVLLLLGTGKGLDARESPNLLIPPGMDPKDAASVLEIMKNSDLSALEGLEDAPKPKAAAPIGGTSLLQQSPAAAAAAEGDPSLLQTQGFMGGLAKAASSAGSAMAGAASSVGGALAGAASALGANPAMLAAAAAAAAVAAAAAAAAALLKSKLAALAALVMARLPLPGGMSSKGKEGACSFSQGPGKRPKDNYEVIYSSNEKGRTAPFTVLPMPFKQASTKLLAMGKKSYMSGIILDPQTKQIIRGCLHKSSLLDLLRARGLKPPDDVDPTVPFMEEQRNFLNKLNHKWLMSKNSEVIKIREPSVSIAEQLRPIMNPADKRPVRDMKGEPITTPEQRMKDLMPKKRYTKPKGAIWDETGVIGTDNMPKTTRAATVSYKFVPKVTTNLTEPMDFNHDGTKDRIVVAPWRYKLPPIDYSKNITSTNMNVPKEPILPDGIHPEMVPHYQMDAAPCSQPTGQVVTGPDGVGRIETTGPGCDVNLPDFTTTPIPTGEPKKTEGKGKGKPEGKGEGEGETEGDGDAASDDNEQN